jgi:hypothetical protein
LHEEFKAAFVMGYTPSKFEAGPDQSIVDYERKKQE